MFKIWAAVSYASFRRDKTRAASFFERTQFIGKVILKINLVWAVKQQEDFMNY